MKRNNPFSLQKSLQRFVYDSCNLAPLGRFYRNKSMPLVSEGHIEDLENRVAMTYRLIRTKRKTVGFIVNEQGLTVRAPSWLSIVEIERLLLKRETWIRRKLRQYQSLKNQAVKEKSILANGASLPFLGEHLVLKLDPFYQDERIEKSDTGWQLFLNLPTAASENIVRERLKSCLRQQALSYLETRIHQMALKANVHFDSWGLSNAKTRWGSCSSSRRILLNWRLIYLKPSLIDYVIAHELAHLNEMNHSERFWKRVDEIFPDYKKAREELKQIYIQTLPV